MNPLTMYIFVISFIFYYFTIQTVSAGLSVKITDSNDIFADFPSDFHQSTDDELKSFGITSDNWKKVLAAKGYSSDYPISIYYHDPTSPLGGSPIYANRNLKPSVTNVEIVEAIPLNQSAVPEIVSTKTCSNKSNSTSIHCHFQLSSSVTDTFSSSWTQSFGVDVNAEISVGFEGFGDASLGTTISTTFDKSASKEQSVTLSDETGVDIDLAPGKSVIAKLVSTRGTAKYQVTYRTYIKGMTVIFWDNPKHGILFLADTTKTVPKDKFYKYATQVIEVGFYSGGTVTVEDAVTKDVLHTKKIPKKIAYAKFL